MKTKTLIGLMAIFLCHTVLRAQTTAFNYQGRLNANGATVNGNYDFIFRIASDPLGINLVGGPAVTNAVSVSNGLFTVTLDFGTGIFTGSNYWLSVQVRTNNGGSYTTLNPLQPITSSPYAILANNAVGLIGTLSASQLTGTLSAGVLSGLTGPVVFTNAGNSFGGTFKGNGANITNVNATALNGLTAGNFWTTSGNAGTAAGVNFVGTTDSNALDFRVNGVRALRLEPSIGAPNIIGGWSNNFVSPGVINATIAGGGGESQVNPGSFLTNQISDSYGTVSGGLGNIAGNQNLDPTDARGATVAGGSQNVAAGAYTTISGGSQNLSMDSSFSTISGGYQNVIQTNSSYSFLGGGQLNVILPNATYSVIGGGGGNNNGSYSATVSGGINNSIQPSAPYAVIGGGAVNVIQTNAQYSAIGGGMLQTIETNSWGSFIGAGYSNNIQKDSSYSVISGGYNNFIRTNSGSSVISGGAFNFIRGSASDSVIAGGENNTVLTNAYLSTISGGANNQVGGAGGTVPGGNGNGAFGINSFAAGTDAQATNDGSFVITDLQYANFNSTANNQLSARFYGGIRFVTAGAGMTLDGQSVLTGGLYNLNLGNQSFTGGGSANYISNNVFCSTIAGGYQNISYSDQATIGGGQGNIASNVNVTISGGGQNFASGLTATISGGFQNRALNNDATIGGGYTNFASGFRSTIAGGALNAASASYTTISGGESNSVAGDSGTIAGGYYNIISATAAYANISGGTGNRVLANGQYGTIAGGRANLATNNAFAAGYNALATNSGAFVWSDGTGTATGSTNFNSVTFRASGGYRLLTSTGVIPGVFLAPSGNSWASISDRNMKKNFTAIDGKSILDKLSQVPVEKWNYQWEADNDVPNMGPMAQDFKKVFYPGRDDKSITTLEFDGVEMAAIKGLNEKAEHQALEMEKKDAELQQLKQKNAALETRLSVLEKLVQSLAKDK